MSIGWFFEDLDSKHRQINKLFKALFLSPSSAEVCQETILGDSKDCHRDGVHQQALTKGVSGSSSHSSSSRRSSSSSSSSGGGVLVVYQGGIIRVTKSSNQFYCSFTSPSIDRLP